MSLRALAKGRGNPDDKISSSKDLLKFWIPHGASRLGMTSEFIRVQSRKNGFFKSKIQ